MCLHLGVCVVTVWCLCWSTVRCLCVSFVRCLCVYSEVFVCVYSEVSVWAACCCLLLQLLPLPAFLFLLFLWHCVQLWPSLGTLPGSHLIGTWPQDGSHTHHVPYMRDKATQVSQYVCVCVCVHLHDC